MESPAILAESLVKRFGDLVALDGVDLVVPAGTVLGLLGPNGAGKTTAVRILTTILRPDEGRATILGRDVAEQADDVRPLIGLAGQYAAVDENLTGRENLRLVGRLTHMSTSVVRPRVEELLDQFDLAAAADRPAKTYSGGMRRRLDLAAALVHRPPVLFLDEPTTGLDPSGRNDLWSVIEQLVADGTTLLLTTQYLEEADRLADRIAVVDHGQVIAEGSAAELKSSIGSTIVRVEMGYADIDVDVMRSVLADVGPVERGGEPRTVEVNVSDSGRSLLDVVRRLDAVGLEPEAISVREPSLDDVFLTLTGRPAEERQQEEVAA